MKNRLRRLGHGIRSAFLSQLREWRTQAARQASASSFQLLETRRVLAVTASLDADSGQLTIELTDAGDIAVLQEDESSLNIGGADFLKSDVQSLVVNSLGSGGGSFEWFRTFASPDTPFSVDSIVINNVDSVRLNSQIITAGSTTIEANSSVELGGELRVQDSLFIVISDANGALTNTPNARIDVFGQANLQANAIELGLEDGDLVNFGSVHFRSTGQVSIAEDSSMSIQYADLVDTTANSADTLVLSASSPLTISSDITVATSASFTASGSASNNDHLTIDNAAVVRLTGSGTLSFLAGDDIVLDTGRIETNALVGSSVVLHAGLDGIGGGDTTAGAVRDLTAGFGAPDVSTHLLTISSNDGINLDTSVELLSASNLLAGNIEIREQNSVEVVNADNPNGSISIVTENDIRIGTILAGQDIFLQSREGSILDASNDAVTDLTAGNLITLHARNQIAGVAPDSRLDLAGNSEVVATTTGLGPIRLRANGDVEFVSVQSQNGAIDILAIGDIVARQIESITDLDSNNISLHSTSGDVYLGFVLAGLSNGDVFVQAFGNILDADSGTDDLDVRGDAVSLLAHNGSIASFVSTIFQQPASTLDVASSGVLSLSALLGSIAVDVSNGVQSALVTSSTAWIQSQGDIDVSDFAVGAVSNLALLADFDQNGSGDLRLDGPITVSGDLRIQGADIVTTDPSGNIVARGTRIQMVSGESENLIVDASAVSNLQLDATSGGVLTVLGNSNVPAPGSTLELVDLDGNGFAARTVGLAASDLSIRGAWDVVVTDAIQSNGRLTISASDDLFLDANVDSNGHLYLLAQNSAVEALGQNGIVMSADATATTNGFNALLESRGEGDVRLGGIDAGNGSVGVVAEGSILNSRALVIGGINVLASNLILVADSNGSRAGAIGSPDLANPNEPENRNAIATQTTNLAATSANGIYIKESNAIQIFDFAGTIDFVQSVSFGGSTSLEALGPVDGLTNVEPNAVIKVVTLAGDIQVNAEILSVGNILLEARGAGSDITTTAGVQSAGGHITLLAADSITIGSDVQTSGNGSIYVYAVAGSLTINSNVSTVNGDILLRAGTDLNINSVVQSAADIGVAAGNDIIQNADVTAGSSAVLSAARDVRLGRVAAPNVGIIAGRDIVDNNGSTVNIEAGNASLRAGRLIGGSDLLSAVDTNGNAIDTDVATLAAFGANGIYIEEANAVAIDTVNAIAPVSVSQVNFRSDTSAVAGTGAGALADLRSGGPVKLVTLNGSITVNDGLPADGLGVESTGSGNILLEARGAGSDITTTAGVQSAGGHITLLAADSITIGSDVQTSGNGSIYVYAVAGSLTINSNVSTVNGDILLRAGTDLNINSVVQSATDIGVVAGNDIVQNADVTAGSSVVLSAARDVRLGRVAATNVGIIAGRDIVDNNGSTVNIEAGNASLRAGRLIGGSDLLSAVDTNGNAIDTDVATLAAFGANGIYIEEANAVAIDTVNAIAPVSVSQVNFRSDTSAVAGTGAGALADLRSGGPVKLVTLNGSITVNDGLPADGLGVESTGSGNILLEARGAGSDITTTAGVQSAGGHITLLAADSITIGSDVQTSGNGSIYVYAVAGSLTINSNVSTVNGDILLRAGTDLNINSVVQSATDIGVVAGNDIVQNADVTAGSSVVLSAARDVRLGRVAATNVGIIAGRDIVDNNGSTVNIEAGSASLRAGRLIGGSDLLSAVDTNGNAIDTAVVTLAAFGANGIYIEEANAVAIDTVNAIAPVSVSQVNFRSDTSAVAGTGAGALADLRSGGPVKLVTLNGSITVNDGLPADGLGVESTGSGNILLEARGAGSDITTTAGVQSAGGHITLLAADDITIGSNVQTSGNGSIYVYAVAGSLTINSNVTTDNGDSLLRAGTDLNINSVVQSATDIGVVAGNDIVQNADVTAGSSVVLSAARDVRLGRVAATNVGIIAGRDIVDNNGSTVNIEAGSASLRAGRLIGGSDLLSAVDTNGNAIDTAVVTLAAFGANGIYIEEANAVAIDTVNAIAPVSVSQVNFRSDTSAVAGTGAGALADLRSGGPVKLVTLNGSITVNDGLPADGLGVESTGSGNILLEARGAGSDITTTAGIQSAGGHITLLAADDIALGDGGQVITAGTGSILLYATNGTAGDGVTMHSSAKIENQTGNIQIVTINDGSVLLGLVKSGRDVSIYADGAILDNNDTAPNTLNIDARSLQLVSQKESIGEVSNLLEIKVETLSAKSDDSIYLSEVDDIRVSNFAATTAFVSQVNFNSSQSDRGVDATTGVIAPNTIRIDAGGFISEVSASIPVMSSLLIVKSGEFVHLSNVTVDRLDASVTANGALDTWQQTNAVASLEGDDFFGRLTETTRNANLSNSGTAVSPSADLQKHFQFQERFSEYALYLVNSKKLEVSSIYAGVSATPNIYVETASGDLVIEGAIQSRSSNPNPGGVVLVAGNKLLMEDTSSISTETSRSAVRTYIVEIKPEVVIGADPKIFFGDFYDAAKPNTVYRSTAFVGSLSQFDNDTEYRHQFQRVAAHFGATGEVGFVTFVGYADGRLEYFENGAIPGNAVVPIASTPRPANYGGSANVSAINTEIGASIAASLASGEPALFVRSTNYDVSFLNANQLLPTDAVVRRADNVFLFQRAVSEGYDRAGEEVSQYEDLTFKSDSILNVRSLGGPGFTVSPEVIEAPVPSPALFVAAGIVPTVDNFPLPVVELPALVERNVRVEVYRVDYDDLNEDGQPDGNELPSPDEVIDRIGQDAKSKPKSAEEASDDVKRAVQIEIPSDAIPKLTTGAPTPAEVEKIKQAILADPTKPTGAYTIIFEDANGKRSVLDIFPVRDIPEDEGAKQGEPLFVPDAALPVPVAPQPDLQSMSPEVHRKTPMRDSVEGYAKEPSPAAASALFLATLCLARNGRQDSQQGAEGPKLENPVGKTISFSRAERLKRRCHRIQSQC